jgi:hypothetical protein
MKSSRVDWSSVVADLARHLAAASATEQMQQILLDAERDLSRLDAPPDFWPRLRAAYRKQLSSGSKEAEGRGDELAACLERFCSLRDRP